MATINWATPEAEATALSTGLDALANLAVATSTAINNETGLYLYMDVELVLASFTPGAGSPYVTLHANYAIDGTNHEKVPDGTSGDKAPIAIFPLEAAVAQASRVCITNIPIAPLAFTLSLRNVSGAAFAANSSTLKYSRHNGASA